MVLDSGMHYLSFHAGKIYQLKIFVLIGKETKNILTVINISLGSHKWVQKIKD